MSETESGIGLIHTVSVHLSVIKKETPCATTDMGFLENPKETCVTVTQRKINILSRKLSPEKHILVGHSRAALSEGKREQAQCFLAYTEYC